MRTGRKKRESRKGQFTVFVIIGIVILVVVLIALFIINGIVSSDLERQGRSAIDDYLKSKSINYYVFTCIDAAVNDVVSQYALQGGVIYDYQGGDYSSNPALEGISYLPFTYKFGRQAPIYFNVSYGIINQSLCPAVSLYPPEYPFDRTKFTDIASTYEASSACQFDLMYQKSGAFGLNRYTRLCYPGSPNSNPKQNVFSPCVNNLALDPAASTEKIIQGQLEKKLSRCINFSYFEMTANDNITVIGPPTTTLVYNDETFAVRLEYPFKVKLKSKDPVILKHSFDYTSKLRLTRLSNFMLKLLEFESKDIFFDYARDYAIVPGYDAASMKVSVVNITSCDSINPNDCSYQNDSVIIVEDRQSRIGNRSLTFMTAVKNRGPALDFIHETNPSQYYDIIVAENSIIKIDPLGKDPDDKPVSYNYIGWKETFDEEFLCDFPLTQPMSSCIKKYEGAPWSPPHNWTTSPEFVQTHKTASYQTNRSDIGPHNLTVEVMDHTGLIDYQIIRILVFDMPYININVTKVYPDIEEGNLSVEDPFTIDATGTTPSQFVPSSQITEYGWQATLLSNPPERQFIVVTPPTQTRLDVPWEDFDIQNKSILNLSKVGPHEIKVRVTQFVPLLGGTADSESTKNVDVYACLPHRNPSDPSPYPYSTSMNPFYADHACCLGSPSDPATYQLANQATTCANETVYGELVYLRDTEAVNFAKENMLTEYRQISPAPNPLVNYINNPAGNAMKNDAYKLEIRRMCDGKRGNICTGPLQATFTTEEACTDAQPGEDETCSGPDSQLSYLGASCVQYNPGNSFELAFNRPTINNLAANGICNKNNVPSRLGTNGYGQVGFSKLTCNATCNTGACGYVRAQDCFCDASLAPQCKGAVADWQGNTCRFSCNDPSIPTMPQFRKDAMTDATACTFASTDTLPCPKVGMGGKTQCVNSNPADVYLDGYCYYNVDCTPNVATRSLGERCESGRTYATGGITYCLYGAAAGTYGTCNANDGSCSLSKMARPAAACPALQSWNCNPISGWICS